MNQEYLNSILIYNAETGMLCWTERRRKKHRGSTAGYVKAQRGLKTRCINIDGGNYKADKVIFRMKTGIWPVEVEHLDGDYLNCSWGNMRAVDNIIWKKPRREAAKLYQLPKGLDRAIQQYRGFSNEQ